MRTVFSLPPRADTTVPDAGAFAITPDGTKLVFSADAPAALAYTAAGHANFTAPMAILPDGTKIAAVADFLAGAGNGSLRIPLVAFGWRSPERASGPPIAPDVSERAR